MKCPKCQNNHPRGKQGMTCICGYGFVLDPKTDGYTDGKFLADIRRAGANGTYFFTKNQLYSAACRGLRIQPAAVVSLLFVAAGAYMTYLSLVNLEDSSNPFLLLLIAGLVFFLIGMLAASSAFFPRLSRKKWDKNFAKWTSSRQPVDGLIDKRKLETPPPDYDETDLYDYGVEQVVICERDELVDWLVMNRYHVNARAAVISETGYPSYLLAKINELLISDEPPKVCLLHDASRHGQQMTNRVQSSGVFDLKKAELVDLGISPQVVPKIRSLKKVRRSTKNHEVTADMIPFAQIQTLSVAAFATSNSFEAECELDFDSGDGDGE